MLRDRVCSSVFSCAFSLAILIQSISHAQTDATEELSGDWFIAQWKKLDLSMLKNQSYLASQFSQQLHAMGQNEAAILIWTDALEHSRREKSSFQSLQEAAIKMDRLDLAEECIPESGSMRNSRLDSLAIARYVRGDDSALENYPHSNEMMTFYDAMDLANALFERGELVKLDEFLTDLEITEENPPEAVAGIIYKRVATEARATGDMDKAKRYIAKAKQVGGHLYYTGYSINVAHASIHGTLLDELDPKTKLAKAYRGHMARELSMGLISELLQLQEFDAAAKVAKDNLEREDDLRSFLSRIILARAKAGDFREALGMIRDLKDPAQQSLSRLNLAKAMLGLGNEKAALELIEFVQPKLDASSDDYKEHYRTLAEIGGTLGDSQIVFASMNSTDDVYLRGLRLLSALKGFQTQFN